MTDRTRYACLLAILGAAACGDDGRPDPVTPVAPPVLARADAAGAGACVHGGTIVRSGPDRNRDGRLDDDEVVTATPVCLEAPPTIEPAPPVLARTRPGVPARTCAGEGTTVESGLDKNRNATLDDDEVTATSYVCDDALLTRMETVSPGDHCAGDGVAFRIGRDDDGDGVLGDAEVEWTEYECSDVISRDVAIHSADDLAAIAKIRVISGALTIQKTSLHEVSLPKLESIGGAVVISLNLSLTRVSLPRLATVGGRFGVGLDDALTELDAPAITRIGGDLLVASNRKLTTLSGLKNVVRVGGDITVEDNAALIDAPFAYGFVKGSSAFMRNPRLAELSISRGDDTGDILVYDNATLAKVQVMLPTWSPSSAGKVTLMNNPKLETVTLYGGRLAELTVLGDAVSEVSVTTPGVAGDVYVESPVLDKVWVASVDSHLPLTIGGDLIVQGPVQSLLFGLSPITVGALYLADSRLERIDRSISNVLGDVDLDNNDLLVSAEFPKVGGGFRVAGNDKLTRFWIIDEDIRHGDVEISDNAALETVVGLQRTREIRGSFTLSGNPKLKRPAMYSLERVGGDVRYRDLPALESFDVPLLAEIGGGLDISGTGAASFAGPPPGFDALRSAAWVQIARNPDLEAIALPRLTRAPQWFFIDENPALKRLGLESFKSTDSLAVRNNKTLAVCEVTRLFDRVDSPHEYQEGNDGSGTCP